MNIFNRHVFLALATSLLLLGCSDSSKNLDAKPAGARLSPRKVVHIAKIAAEREGMNLSNYKEPDPRYESVRAKTWEVFFDGQNAAAGKHFYIYVEDQTEETRYFENK